MADPCKDIELTLGGAFQGCSPVASFEEISPNMNEWTGSGRFGAIAGFAAFGLAYLITIVMIFQDIRKRYQMYLGHVAEDLEELKQLESKYTPQERAKIDTLRAEELKRRIAGKKVEDKGDDQLLGEAVKLRYNP